jgi:hypothetical protein
MTGEKDEQADAGAASPVGQVLLNVLGLARPRKRSRRPLSLLIVIIMAM